MKFKIKVVVGAVVPLMLVSLSACTIIGSPFAPPTSTAPVAPPISAAPLNPSWKPPAVSQANLPNDLSPIVTKVKPAVVSINVEIPSTNIFNLPTTEQGAGSGWIIDPNGYIVTNNHVVEGADNITVTLDDGRDFQAVQVATDPLTDIAVIKINASGLPSATVGNSDNLKVGMVVAAIGNALGRGISMTGGYVSRRGASITVDGNTLYDLIETDAAINPGNSGGPLVDTAGEVIGITNAKLVATGVEGVGFAISINGAMPIIRDLITKGSAIHAFLGVTLQTVTPDIVSLNHLAVNKGVMISAISPDTPAEKAGLKEGDVIVNVNGKDVTEAANLAELIRSSQVGQTLTITYWRGDVKSTITAVLAARPS